MSLFKVCIIFFIIFFYFVSEIELDESRLSFLIKTSVYIYSQLYLLPRKFQISDVEFEFNKLFVNFKLKFYEINLQFENIDSYNISINLKNEKNQFINFESLKLKIDSKVSLKSDLFIIPEIQEKIYFEIRNLNLNTIFALNNKKFLVILKNIITHIDFDFKFESQLKNYIKDYFSDYIKDQIIKLLNSNLSTAADEINKSIENMKKNILIKFLSNLYEAQYINKINGRSVDPLIRIKLKNFLF